MGTCDIITATGRKAKENRSTVGASIVGGGREGFLDKVASKLRSGGGERWSRRAESIPPGLCTRRKLAGLWQCRGEVMPKRGLRATFRICSVFSRVITHYCVASGKLLHLSVLCAPHLQSGEDNIATLLGVFED